MKMENCYEIPLCINQNLKLRSPKVKGGCGVYWGLLTSCHKLKFTFTVALVPPQGKGKHLPPLANVSA